MNCHVNEFSADVWQDLGQDAVDPSENGYQVVV
jgi:hypothetical protein